MVSFIDRKTKKKTQKAPHTKQNRKQRASASLLIVLKLVNFFRKKHCRTYRHASVVYHRDILTTKTRINTRKRRNLPVSADDVPASAMMKFQRESLLQPPLSLCRCQLVVSAVWCAIWGKSTSVR